MDENSEQIFDQLRPLFVYLLEQGIENYVQSSNFRNMCILNKWEGIWEQSCTQAEINSYKPKSKRYFRWEMNNGE